jgi:hypothetical protein
MPDINEITKQCSLAFDFIQKLYLEVSYFIKGTEGILGEHDFVIGKPRGYQISTRSSSGLEPVNVNLWLLKRFGVFFAPKEKFVFQRGTKLSIENPTKVLYLRVILNDNTISEPTVYSGVLYDVQKQPNTDWPTSFEQAMAHIEYNDDRIFRDTLQSISYEDTRIRLKGELIKNALFEMDGGEAIRDRIIKPSLELYEKY